MPLMKGWLPALFLAVAMPSALPAAQLELPVYLEESHAGSFYFFASTLPLDEPHALILVDAHTDASGVAASDDIRSAIRQGPTLTEQAKLFARWRESGRIQCYDWIEPLMPAPVQEVFWLAAPLLPGPRQAELERTAREQLDGHEEALPRNCGELAEKYHALDLPGLEKELATWPEDRAVIASIDLDYFAAMPEEQLEKAMDQVLDPILRLRGLRALSFAVSSPWQESAGKAERLVFLALDAVLRVPRARLQIEPYAFSGPDKSLMAQKITKQGGKIPVFEIAQSGPALRSLLVSHWRPEMTLTNRVAMEKQVATFRNDPFLPHLAIPGRLTAPDGDWYLDANELPGLSIQVQPEPLGAAVHWQAILPASTRARVMDGPWSYAEGTPRWLRWKVEPMGDGTNLPLSNLTRLLNAKIHSGTIKLRAEVVRDGESRFSTPVTLRVRSPGSSGFRAALSEEFGLPYVFGSAFLQSFGPDGCRRTGAECQEGADCANFISAAFRAQGWRTRWGGVSDLLPSLAPLPDNIALPPDAAQRGLVLDFGAHAAALWEDRPPLGRLDGGDLCAHHLEGFPQILTLTELGKDRPVPRLFSLDRAAEAGPRLVFGGDVMLARTIGTRLTKGETVLQPLVAWFKDATAIVNLECAIPDHPGAAAGKFAAPPAAATALYAAGIRAVSLANNHSSDAGAVGLSATVKNLGRAQIKSFGYTPEPVPLAVPGSTPFTLFGWYEQGPITAAALAEKIRGAKHSIVFAHWGLEHSRVPTNQQRAAAATFIKAGAQIIVGSGPHAVAPLEWIDSVPVAWSLGNLVFDDEGPDAEWRRGALLEITLSPKGDVLRCQLVELPVVGASLRNQK